jgi:hypothetical protein
MWCTMLYLRRTTSFKVIRALHILSSYAYHITAEQSQKVTGVSRASSNIGAAPTRLDEMRFALGQPSDRSYPLSTFVS